MRILSELISHISTLMSWIPSVVTEDNYLDVGTSSDGSVELTGLSGKITLVADQDMLVGFDEATGVNSLLIPANQVVSLSQSAKTIYAKGSTKAGKLRILTENLNTGKSDQQLMDEAYVRK